jgi:serine/threonine protein kinase
MLERECPAVSDWQESLLPSSTLTAPQLDHLDLCEDCRRVLAELVADDLRPNPVSPDPSQTNAERTIGRFQQIELAGLGAMGVIYRGYDPMLGRPLAIKVLRAAAEGAAEQLLREAQVMARLSHHGSSVPSERRRGV